MRVLITGHSFVARYTRYLSNRNVGNSVTDTNYGPTLGLPRETVFVRGVGGLKADRDGLDRIKSWVSTCHPDIVILEIGTNELADRYTADDNSVANWASARIIDFVDELHHEFAVRFVVVCKVVKRRGCRGSFTYEFERRRDRFNLNLESASVGREGYFMPYRHDRTILVNIRQGDVCGDNIHFTTGTGLRLYHFSLRKAILMALAKVRALD